MGAYKLFWVGYERGIHGVGVLVAEKWIEKVAGCEARRVRD